MPLAIADARVIGTLIAGLAVTAVWLSAMLLYPDLPERIPTHFDLAGNPDRWGDKSEVFALCGVATGVCLMMCAVLWLIPWMAVCKPHMVNMLDNRWRSLPPDQRAAVFQPMCLGLGLVAAMTSLLFIFILISTARSVQSDAADPRVGPWPFFVMVPLLLIVVIGGIALSQWRATAFITRAQQA